MWETVIVTPLTNVLLWINTIVGGYFWIAIILFTILIRLATHPLMAKQMKSTAALQEMQQSKEWQNIQAKYKGDKEKLAQEQMKIYKEAGVSPFGSCLPTMIQLPIIFGLYQSVMRALSATPLQLTYLVKSADSFVGSLLNINITEMIPLNSNFLWMNLGQPERVTIFGYGISILAIIVAITTFVQSKLTMPAANTANPADQSAQMGKMMSLYMPLMLLYFAWNYASGLALYFIVSNLLGIAQYALLGKANWKNLLPKSLVPAIKTGGKK
jgi:YidC/Oxa1 family membrane protein insertase